MVQLIKRTNFVYFCSSVLSFSHLNLFHIWLQVQWLAVLLGYYSILLVLI